jgi:hypothetical protein
MAPGNVVGFLLASANKALGRPMEQRRAESAAGVFQNAPGNDRGFNSDDDSIARGKLFVKPFYGNFPG